MTNPPFFSRLVEKHQHLAGADNGVVAHFISVEHRLASWIDVEALAEPGANLADGGVAERQALAVGPHGDRDEPGRLVGFGKEAAQSARGSRRFMKGSGKFSHRLETR